MFFNKSVVLLTVIPGIFLQKRRKCLASRHWELGFMDVGWFYAWLVFSLLVVLFLFGFFGCFFCGFFGGSFFGSKYFAV